MNNVSLHTVAQLRDQTNEVDKKALRTFLDNARSRRFGQRRFEFGTPFQKKQTHTRYYVGSFDDKTSKFGVCVYKNQRCGNQSGQRVGHN